MDEISQTINESCFSCQNIGQILIWMILVVSKCSIYDVKHPIFLIFRGPQTPHTATIFEKILQTILFYENKGACHILGTICDTFRISNKHGQEATANTRAEESGIAATNHEFRVCAKAPETRGAAGGGT